MTGRIEIRTSGEKFRFVVLNRSGEKLLQSGQFGDKRASPRHEALTCATRDVAPFSRRFQQGNKLAAQYELRAP